MSQGARRQAIHLPHARSRINENEDAAARWRKIIDEKQSASQEQGREPVPETTNLLGRGRHVSTAAARYLTTIPWSRTRARSLDNLISGCTWA